MTTSHREQLNEISDTLWSSAPFRKIGPKKEAPLSARMNFWTVIVFTMILVTGKFAAALVFSTEVYPPRFAGMFVVYSFVSYHCYSLTFVRAWNDRARELAHHA